MPDIINHQSQKNFALQLAKTQEVVDLLNTSEYKDITDVLVNVRYSFDNQQLIVDYTIHVPKTIGNAINWYTPKEQCIWRDFLWENTCLEVFIGSQSKSAYIEINACPNGDFAVYDFDGYRSPSCMPPKALYRTDDSTEARTPHKAKVVVTSAGAEAVEQCVTMQTRLRFSIDQLPSSVANYDLINLAVILFITTTDTQNQSCSHPLYFSHSHPNPADFHNQHHWIQA